MGIVLDQTKVEQIDEKIAEAAAGIKWKSKTKSFLVNGANPELNFNNLEIGKKYRLTARVSCSTSGSHNALLSIMHDDSSILQVGRTVSSGTGDVSESTGSFTIFTAVTNKITASTNISGSGAISFAEVILEELPLNSETDQW